MERVLGIGVAVIDKTCGDVPFSINNFLCSTPNLCCSSIIINPKSLKLTGFCIRECVPIINCISPDANSLRIIFFSFCGILDVIKPHVILTLSQYSFMLSKCCSANISVGAIKATCFSSAITIAAVRTATMVFPEPTSP